MDVKLTCQVKMYPSMDRQEDASWSWGPKGNRTKITSESSVDGFAFSMGVSWVVIEKASLMLYTLLLIIIYFHNFTAIYRNLYEALF